MPINKRGPLKKVLSLTEKVENLIQMFVLISVLVRPIQMGKVCDRT